MSAQAQASADSQRASAPISAAQQLANEAALTQAGNKAGAIASSKAYIAAGGSGATTTAPAGTAGMAFAPGSRPGVITQSGNAVFKNGTLVGSYANEDLAKAAADSYTSVQPGSQPLNIMGDLGGSTFRSLYKAPSEKTIEAPTVFTGRQAAEQDQQNMTDYQQITEGMATQGEARANAPEAPATTPYTPLPAAKVDENGAPIPMDPAEVTNAALANIQAQTEEAYQTYKDQVTSIQNGTFPLSPTEQASLDAIQQSIDRAVAAQKEVNKATIGTVTELGIRSGRQRYAGEVNAGIISAVISQGVQAIADIETKGAVQLADARTAMQDKDLERLDKSMTMFREMMNDKSNVIQTMHDNTLKYEEFVTNQAQKTQAIANQTIDSLAKAGIDPSQLDPIQLSTLDAKAGYPQGTSAALLGAAIKEKQKEDEKAQLEGLNTVIDVTSKLDPSQYVDFNGSRYYGTKSNEEYKGYEIDQASGDVTVFSWNTKENKMTAVTQKGVLPPNIPYTKTELTNADGSTSLWWVPENPGDGVAIPVTGEQTGGAQGVNTGALQEDYPPGTKGSPTDPDYWCLGWARNVDQRGQAFANMIGDTIQEKRAAGDKSIGFSGGTTPPQAGDWVLTNEDSKYGHIALISEIRTDPKTGKQVAVLAESNFKPGTVTYSRTIPLDSSNMEGAGGKIMGFVHGELKPEYSSQPTAPTTLGSAPKTVAGGTFNPDTGYVENMSSDDIRKVNQEITTTDAYKAVTTASDLQSAITDFEDLLKTTPPGSARLVGDSAGKLKSAYNAFTLQLKDFLNLGVLNGPDLALIQSIVPPPWRASLTGGTEAGLPQAKSMIEKQIADRTGELLTKYSQYNPDEVNALKIVQERGEASSGKTTMTKESLKQSYPQYSSQIDAAIAQGLSPETISAYLSNK